MSYIYYVHNVQIFVTRAGNGLSRRRVMRYAGMQEASYDERKDGGRTHVIIVIIIIRP
jgi:hypothetical protein